jgi:hypothetical protein
MSIDRSPDLRLHHEWENAPGVRAPELRATWARLEVRVGDESATQIEDQRAATTRRSIYVSLYPLAEWIAYNWWFLRFHSRLTGLRPEQYDYRAARRKSDVASLRNHNFRGASDGFLWPNLTIVPDGRRTRLVWRSDHAEVGRGIRFAGDGDVFLETLVVEQRLAEFVDAVVTRLLEQDVRDTPLEAEWHAIRNTEADEAEFCAASARMGLDPYDDAHEFAELITEAGATLDTAVFSEFVDAVHPLRMESGVAWLHETTDLIREAPTSSLADNILRLRREVGSTGARAGAGPWRVGWADARRTRGALGIDDVTPLGLDEFVLSREHKSEDRRLEALGGYSDAGGPVIVLGREVVADSRRFSQARGLWRILATPDTSRFLLTSARSTPQSVGRAFAAEVLAPAAGIRRLLDGDSELVFSDDLDRIGAHFGVSPWVIRHQAENQLELHLSELD